MAETDIAFGPFSFDPDAATLSRGGQPVALGGREAALLHLLLEANGAVVEKSRLIDRVWGGMAVEDGNLAVQISGLRKALGLRQNGEDWIVTVARVGYRLPRDASIADATPRVPRIAVLPFDSFGGSIEQSYFADGIVEDIITALSRFRSFAVIARNSSFAYRGRASDVRQIAAELNVRYLLEGSVRLAGKKLRIAAQLVDAADGVHLWAQNFDGAVDDVFDVQDHITEKVVGIIEPRIQQAEIARSRRERPGSLAAYDLYLRALPKHAAMTPADNAEAIALLEQALALDPGYAVAMKVLTDVLSCRINMGWSVNADDRARCLAMTASALANAAGDATIIAQCGAIYVFIAHEYQRGMSLIERALEANPNNVEALTCAANVRLQCGNIEVARAEALRALDLSPADPLNEHFLTINVAFANLLLGDDEAALRWAERGQAVNPSYDPAYWILIASSHRLGRAGLARDWLTRYRALRPSARVGPFRANDPQRYPERSAAVFDAMVAAGMPE